MFKKIIFLMIVLVLLALIPNRVSAQGSYQIKQMTPEVTAALEGRRARFENLRLLKSQGIVGENNQGYVQVVVKNSDAKVVVDAENKDRKAIYETIAKQNGLENAVETIEKVFAQVQRDKAESGHKVQDAEGHWVSK